MNKLTEEQRKTIEENLGMVYFTVDRFFKNCFCFIGREELISEGMYALCKCIPYYDKDKGNISTFICKCVKKHLSTYISKNIRTKIETVSLEDIKEEIAVFDRYEDNTTDKLKEFLYNHLPNKIANMTIDYYIDNYDWESIARKYGYSSRKSACAIVQRALKNLGKSKYLRDKYINLFI